MRELLEQLRIAGPLTTEANLMWVAIAFVTIAGVLFWIGTLVETFVLDALLGRALRVAEGTREGAELTVKLRKAVIAAYAPPQPYHYGWGFKPADQVAAETARTARPKLSVVK